jgi:tRNA-2-methylthio-N6-dimethylallyladenosine synthase
MKYYVKSYGCQMNVYDSQRMEEMLEGAGYVKSETYEDAKIVILNTCHIREKAAEKVYSELGRIRPFKEQNKAIIIVAGCVAQAEGEEVIKRMPYVDIVIGPQNIQTLVDAVGRIIRGEKRVVNLDFDAIDKFDSLNNARAVSGVSAFLTIQEGCDKFCTFCVVPYTRGAEVSRTVEDVLNEAKRLVDGGVKEISLLGQNVNAYHGVDLGGKERGLTYLCEKLSEINGLERIRYTTSHPLNMTDDLIKAHGYLPKLMPFLHLPVQSGSNYILGAMNRKHTRELYFEIVDKLRKERADIAFSSDFIVGFPGESDMDFLDTLDLVKRVGFTQCYSFKYSTRPGTPAALKDQVPEEVKDARLQELQALLNEQFRSFNDSFLGKKLHVLFEKEGVRAELNQVNGKSEYFQAVSVNLSQSQPLEQFLGKTIPVNITQVKTNSLIGEFFTPAN